VAGAERENPMSITLRDPRVQQMPRITLPDGTVKTYDEPVSARRVAEDIGSRLAKAAVGAKIDGQLADLDAPIDHDCALEIVTPTTRDGEPDPDALYLMRHSAAHVMAEAIQRIEPRAQLVYGPPVEQGFFYDIAFPEDRPLSTDDFERIEQEMAKIVEEDRPFRKYELDPEVGFQKLQRERSEYKLDNARRAMEAGAKKLSWYVTGEPTEEQRTGQPFDPGEDVEDSRFNTPDGAEAFRERHGEVFGYRWEDLCRGPHVPSTGKIGAYKVMSLASSYWHGDESSDRLTRVYGTAFPTKKHLDAHLERLEEAKKRDHRVLGKRLGLFHIDEMVGQGLILWTPRGAVVRDELQKFIGAELTRRGYQQVFTPHIGRLELYRTSGHFPYYQDSQYPPIVDRETLHHLADEHKSCADLANLQREGEVSGYLLKPMNCPHHIRIYQSQPRSYRDLPVRLAEFGTVYRWEQSGEISGMTRVRGFTQDDAHVFCTEDQVLDELTICLDIVRLIFSTLGMSDYRVRVGLRDPDSSKYVGDPSNWNQAEDFCRQGARSLGVEYTEEPGEAAFYGPKIDFVVKDVIGREWQLGTVQVDYNLPERFDLAYTGADNRPHRPVMIHRAPFGSMERFVGVLIEHFAGAFPAWLAPEQARVLPISDKSNDYAREVLAALAEAGVRAGLDDSNERVQAKIKIGAEEKIPYLLVVGPRDAENRTVSIRARGVQKDLGARPLAEFVQALEREIRSRGGQQAVATPAR